MKRSDAHFRFFSDAPFVTGRLRAAGHGNSLESLTRHYDGHGIVGGVVWA